MNIKFTGGKHFIGINKLYHRIMMKNELLGGFGGYKLSYSGGKGGFSFGGTQVDLSVNPKYKSAFIDILTKAKDKTNTTFLQSNEITFINQHISVKGKTPEKVFGSEIVRKINAALSSPYGIEKINKIYQEEIEVKAEKIDKILNLMANSSPYSFYNTALGKGLLFDYNNQFNIDTGGKFMKYVQNFPQPEYSYENHVAYMHDLKYAKDGHMADIDRRLENVKKAVKEWHQYDEHHDHHEEYHTEL